MDRTSTTLESGIEGLDRVINGLMLGDNVVWLVDNAADYALFAASFARRSVSAGRKFVYFRFASHEPILDTKDSAFETHVLNPETGFEPFIDSIHRTIEKQGAGACYVFDCLSELAGDWYSDQMLGNFFMLTCPYLYDLETVAYFSLRRHYHSAYASVPIADTTQVMIEVIRKADKIYIHPIKVQQRTSRTIHMLHVWEEGGSFKPVASSAEIADVFSDFRNRPIFPRVNVTDSVARLTSQAESILASHTIPDDAALASLRDRLCRSIISREDRILELASKYLTLDDLMAVANRMVGTGLIGGKAVGMLIARAILRQSKPELASLLEPHDSFYVGSDVFYTFLVRNGIWWLRRKLQNPDHLWEGAEEARRRILPNH